MSDGAIFVARCGCRRVGSALPLEVNPSAAIAAAYEQKTMWRQPEGRGLTANRRNASVSAADCVNVSFMFSHVVGSVMWTLKKRQRLAWQSVRRLEAACRA